MHRLTALLSRLRGGALLVAVGAAAVALATDNAVRGLTRRRDPHRPV